MDGSAAIEQNRLALKRIALSLMAMAGLDIASHPRAQADSVLVAEVPRKAAAPFTSPQGQETRGGGREASAGGCELPITPTRRSGDRRPPHTREAKPTRPTLPRHLWLAILRLLRPAEAAARRLIIAAARGLTVTLPPPRQRQPKPLPAVQLLRRLGIAVTMSPADRAAAAATAKHASAPAPTRPRRLSLPLFDPPRRYPHFHPHPELVEGEPVKGVPVEGAPVGLHPHPEPVEGSLTRGPRRRTVPAHAAPRIMLPGVIEPHRLPPPPSANDPVSAVRLHARLAALAAALDDLPGQARRFARWKARRDMGLTRRVWPLRAGRPPGGRLSRFDPTARRHGAGKRRRAIRAVDEILAHAHALALDALESPDTS